MGCTQSNHKEEVVDPSTSSSSLPSIKILGSDQIQVTRKDTTPSSNHTSSHSLSTLESMSYRYRRPSVPSGTCHFKKLNAKLMRMVFSFVDSLDHFATLSCVNKKVRKTVCTQKYWDNLILKPSGIKLSPNIARNVVRNLKCLKNLTIQTDYALRGSNAKLTDILKKVPSDVLTSVTLRDIEFTRSTVPALKNLITLKKSLRKLELINVKLCTESISESIGCVQNDSELEHLAICGVDLSENYIPMFRKIAELDDLTTLIMRDNRLTAKGSTSLLYYIRNLTKLRHLDVSENMIGFADKDGGIEYAEFISGNTSIKHLDLSGNRLGSTALLAIGQAMESSRTFESLRISQNNFEPEAMEKFFKMVSRSSGVKKLDFSYNHFATHTQDYICNLIRHNSLEELSLEGCRVNFYGTESLAKALKKNNCLRKLNLSKNRIDVVALQRLFSGFKGDNKELEFLDLRDNTFGSEAVPTIVRSCKKKRSCRAIAFNRNTISEEHLNLINIRMFREGINCNITPDSSPTNSQRKNKSQ